MKKPPHNVVYQEGRWAITELDKDTKADALSCGRSPNDPWLMHYCRWQARSFWNIVLDIQGGDTTTHQCVECGKQPPDKITTIWRLYV